MTVTARVLILTSNAGFGHISAARAINAALQERYGDEVSVQVANPLENGNVPGILRGTTFDYDEVVRERPYLHQITYWLTNQALPSSIYSLIMAQTCSKIIGKMVEDFQPDVIVTTYLGYQSTLKAIGTQLARKIPVFTVVTDLAEVHRLWFHPVSNFYLVPTAQVQKEAQAYRVPPEKIRITGIPVNLRLGRCEESPGRVRERLGWAPDRLTALVVGSKRVRNLASYLEALNQPDLPLQLAVTAGGDSLLLDRLQQTKWKIPVHLYDFVEDISDHMLAADLVISKAGGLIISEALAGGKPLLLVDALPGQETGNVRYVLEEGVGKYAQSPPEALEIITGWAGKDASDLDGRTGKARLVGRPQAAEDAARLIWEAASLNMNYLEC